MTHGKIENYYLPGQFEARLVAFVDYYNSRRYHESLKNLPPADVYFGRSQTMPAAPPVCAFNFNSDGPDPILIPLLTCPKGSDDVHIRLARLLQALQPFRKQPLSCSMFTNHSLMVQTHALVSLRCFTVFQKNLVLQMCNYGRCLPWLPSFVGYLPIDRPDYGNIRSS